MKKPDNVPIPLSAVQWAVQMLATYHLEPEYRMLEAAVEEYRVKNNNPSEHPGPLSHSCKNPAKLS